MAALVVVAASVTTLVPAIPTIKVLIVVALCAPRTTTLINNVVVLWVTMCLELVVAMVLAHVPLVSQVMPANARLATVSLSPVTEMVFATVTVLAAVTKVGSPPPCPLFVNVPLCAPTTVPATETALAVSVSATLVSVSWRTALAKKAVLSIAMVTDLATATVPALALLAITVNSAIPSTCVTPQIAITAQLWVLTALGVWRILFVKTFTCLPSCPTAMSPMLPLAIESLVT